MAKELRHKDPPTKLTRVLDNALDRHYLTGGSESDIPVYDATNAKLVGKTPAEVAALLDHGLLTGLGDDDHTQYIKHSLATVANDFLVASGSGAFVKKTLAETQTLIGNNASNKLLSHTRVKDANSGDVSYTTYGFQPKALIIFASLASGNLLSWGFGDKNLAEMCVFYSIAACLVNTSAIVDMEAAGAGQSAVLKTLDADGFTLTWTKIGAGASNNIIIIVLALY